MNNVRAKESVHKAVLLNEVVDLLVTKWGEKAGQKSASVSTTIPTYLDGTLGGAGHALAVAKALGGKLNIIGLDRDQQALERAERTLGGHCKTLILKNENFRNLDKVLAERKISGSTGAIGPIVSTGSTTDLNTTTGVDMILLDLGISSDELDNSKKGFTFQKDEPLHMTMGEPEQYPFTAKDIVNKWDEEVIANIIFGYAEEKFARRIARAIVSYRMKKQIETTMELAELVKLSVPGFYRRGRIHPATKTFQALRIAVNDELGALKEGLKKGY
jgi:16S rRNA (cytosine1402-N4)-methyltransferase